MASEATFILYNITGDIRKCRASNYTGDSFVHLIWLNYEHCNKFGYSVTDQMVLFLDEGEETKRLRWSWSDEK